MVPDAAQHARILECSDPATLAGWSKRVLVASSLEQVFEDLT